MKKIYLLITIVALLAACTKNEIVELERIDAPQENESMALPSSNIGVAEVKAILGNSSNSVGVLCTASNINKWSRWKPVRHSSTDPLTANQIRALRSGLDIPLALSYNDLISYFRANPSATWGYNKPRGDSVTPVERYRIDDFHDYKHDAYRPYNVYVPNRVYQDVEPKVPVSVGMALVDPLVVNWESLNVEGYYLGALVVRKGQTTPYEALMTTQTLEEMAESGYIEVRIPSPVFGATYDVFVFISLGGTPYFLLEDGYKQVIYSYVFEVFITAEWNAAHTTINYSIELRNYTGSTLNLYGSLFYIRYSTSLITDPIQTGEKIVYLPSPITIPGNDSVIINGSESGLLPDYATKGGYVYFSNNTYPQSNKYAGINDPM